MLSLSAMSISSKKTHRCAGFQKRQRVKEQKLKPPHTTEPEADVAVAAVRVVVAAIGAPRVVGVVVPIAAAQNTVAPRCRACWISSSGLTIRRPIPIPTPLRYIPRHVVKAISVRRKIAHRTRVGRRPGIEEGVETGRAQIVAIVAGISVVVGLALGY